MKSEIIYFKNENDLVTHDLIDNLNLINKLEEKEGPGGTGACIISCGRHCICCIYVCYLCPCTLHIWILFVLYLYSISASFVPYVYSIRILFVLCCILYVFHLYPICIIFVIYLNCVCIPFVSWASPGSICARYISYLYSICVLFGFYLYLCVCHVYSIPIILYYMCMSIDVSVVFYLYSICICIIFVSWSYDICISFVLY